MTPSGRAKADRAGNIRRDRTGLGTEPRPPQRITRRSACNDGSHHIGRNGKTDPLTASASGEDRGINAGKCSIHPQ